MNEDSKQKLSARQVAELRLEQLLEESRKNDCPKRDEQIARLVSALAEH